MVWILIPPPMTHVLLLPWIPNSFSIVIVQFLKVFFFFALLISFIYLFSFLVAPRGMWDIVSWPGFEPAPPAVEAWSLNQ